MRGLLLLLVLLAFLPHRVGAQVLKPVTAPTLEAELDPQLWRTPAQRQALLRALNHSLRYLQTPQAAKAYRNYPVPGVTKERARRSLLRFQTLLAQAKTPQALESSLKRDFVFYQAQGQDNQGTVHFTGYFEPVYQASRRRTGAYQYPVYGLPKNFSRWPKPHPTRAELEGRDGRGGQLKGSELLWFSSRLSAYLVQIQGSAKINLLDGARLSLAFAGSTDYPYVSLGKELVKDGVFQPGEVTLPLILDYFRQNPQQLSAYIPRNQRFIFFKLASAGAPAQGSIGVPVTAERSIATDKSLMPPGALALLQAPIPDGNLQKQTVSRFVMDQDTGSAIKGPGRVDIFMGTGELAGARAGLMSDDGVLYYLMLK